MDKTTFISALKERLHDHDFPTSTVKEVIEDYTILIDEAIEGGEDESTFIERLGAPKEIVRSLKKELPHVINVDNKLIAVSPFIALIIFFYLGFAFDAWHPGWMAFLLIPITAITLQTKGLERWVALSVFISLIAFMLLGTYVGIWHPMWALFLSIAGFGFLTHKNTLVKWFGVYTFVASIAFILLVLFLNPDGYIHFLLLLPIPIMGILTGEIDIIFFEKRLSIIISTLVFITILTALYLFIGYGYGLWHPTWIIFLTIPLGALLYTQFVKKEPVEVVAYTPFIALIIFFLWGELGNAYQYSWLIFLLIPITAIVFNKSH